MTEQTFEYTIIGVWKSGNEFSHTYTSWEDAHRQVKTLGAMPAIDSVKVLTYTVTRKKVDEYIFEPRPVAP